MTHDEHGNAGRPISVRRHRQAKMWLAPLVAAGLLTALAACGDDDSSSSATTAGGAATTAASAATTASGGATTSASGGGSSTAGGPGDGTCPQIKSEDGGFAPIPDGPIRLAMSLPLSGPYAAPGNNKQALMTSMLKNFNEICPDGIAGHKIELVIKDDSGDEAKGVAVANQFVADKVPMMISASLAAGVAQQQVEIWNKAKIPMLLDSAGKAEYLNAKAYPYVFFNGPTFAQSGDVAGQWFGKHPEYKNIALLSDGAPATEQQLNYITASMAKNAPDAKITKTVTITTGAVDVSTAITQLKAANPDIVMVFVSYGYGPIWNAMHTANWKPPIFTSAGLFYDGYDALGDLAPTTYDMYFDCAPKGVTFPDFLTKVMDDNLAVTKLPNQLINVQVDLEGAFMMSKYAIEKYNSVDPDAIKKALEQLNGPAKGFFWDQWTWNYTPDNHAGFVGTYSAQVCDATLSNGKYQIPFINS